jgi:Golgi nucleoside diphosphatase
MNNELQTTNNVSEVTRLTSAGGGTTAFAAKVKSNYAYNVYKVRLVEILAEGVTPVELGDEMKATNLAEDFTQQGQLPTGKYVLVCTAGDKNVFYANP